VKQPGFVLIAMLGLLLVTSSLALAAGLRTRARLARADMFAEAVRAEAAARIGVLAAIDSISVLIKANRFADPHSHTWLTVDTIADVTVATTTGDLSAKLSINTASDVELRQFLMNSGVAAREADIASQSIADWRDPDQLHRPRGAEAEWYRSAGFDYVPSDRPIVTYAELGHVRGVTVDILEVLETNSSLNGDGRINVNSAPIGVLASLPGMSPSAAAAIIAHRAERRLTNLAEMVEVVPDPWRDPFEEALPAIAPRLTFALHDVEIRTRAMAGKAVFRIHAVAHHTGEGRFVIIRTYYPN
jgi:general secretion pathway protein K